MATTRTGRSAAVTPDPVVAAEPSAAVTTAPAPVVPGDEVPPANRPLTLLGDEPPVPVILPGDEPPLAPVTWVDPVDARDAPIAHLMQPPVIRGLDTNPEFRLPVPPASGVAEEWDPDGVWYFVRSDIYRRQLGDDEVRQARAGDRVRVPDDERTADDVRNLYLLPLE